MPRYFPVWQSKEMSHEFVRGQSAAETCSATGAMWYVDQSDGHMWRRWSEKDPLHKLFRISPIQ